MYGRTVRVRGEAEPTPRQQAGPGPPGWPPSARWLRALAFVSVRSGAIAGVVFGLLNWALGDDAPLFAGVFFGVFMALFWFGYGLYRRRKDGPTPLPDASERPPRG